MTKQEFSYLVHTARYYEPDNVDYMASQAMTWFEDRPFVISRELAMFIIRWQALITDGVWNNSELMELYSIWKNVNLV